MTRAEAKKIKRATTLEELHRMADAVLSRARRSAARHAPSRKEREGKRAERAQRTANVRVEVFKRDGGRCVICGADATDMHHLVYGSGWRRVAESGKTCASVCRPHHDMAHAGSMSTLLSLRTWARGNGYSMAADALTRRLAKIEARAVRRTGT